MRRRRLCGTTRLEATYVAESHSVIRLRAHPFSAWLAAPCGPDCITAPHTSAKVGPECLATNTHIRSAQEMQVSQGMRDGLPGFAER